MDQMAKVLLKFKDPNYRPKYRKIKFTQKRRQHFGDAQETIKSSHVKFEKLNS